MAPLNFGTLLFDYQATDVLGPFDLLNCCTKATMTSISKYGAVNEEVITRAPEFAFHQISETLDPVHVPGSWITIVPSTTIDDCPDLDYLLIGGPNPAEYKLSPRYVEFIRRHVDAGKILFTNCTGSAVVASTGILDGKNATINHQIYHWAKEHYPKVRWTRDKKWVVDGNIWTAGGALAGMDMVSHWIRENYGLDVLVEGSSTLDYEPRDIDGLYTVLPKRFDKNGKQVSTHVFR